MVSINDMNQNKVRATYEKLLVVRAQDRDEQAFRELVTLYERRMLYYICLLYTSPSPRDQRGSRMPSSA